MTVVAYNIEEEKKEILKRYRALLRAVKPRLQDGDRAIIRKAFELSLDAHKEMRRKSGEPYIFHPIAVAQICAEEIGLGTTSVVCALLHDVVEDTHIDLITIQKQFGGKVASIIDGLTKVSSSVFDTETNSPQAENFRKMLLTLGDDVRVILIKLADRLHNMRTLGHMTRAKQLKIASETMYIYAPLSHRLGLYAIKTELEDLSLKITNPKVYKEIADKLAATKNERNKFIKHFIDDLDEKIKKTGLSYEIKGRPKSIYSIWKKMQKQEIPFEKIYDLFAIRVILDSQKERERPDCFLVFGVLTDSYINNPARYRDWITRPRGNGYESLHATVMSEDGKWVEVQIRTRRMDDIAEKGYAAHWKYKESGFVSDNGLEEWLKMVRETLENPETNALDFISDFKMNFFSEEIFVFTPKGKLVKLPAGATSLDFAYDIHSDVGNHCIGAKVNNKLVPLSHKLTNGDTIEIITSQKQKPNEDWLKFVITAKAKSKIRYHFKEIKRAIAMDGEEILQRKFRHAHYEYSDDNILKVARHFNLDSKVDLLYLIGKGNIDKTTLNLTDILFNTKKSNAENIEPTKEFRPVPLAKDTVIIDESDSPLDYSLAICCHPIPGDDIFAFVTIGEGIKVHRTACNNAPHMMATNGYRVLKAHWASADVTTEKQFLAGIRIIGTDGVGIVRSITEIISNQLNVNMRSIAIDTVDGRFEGTINLYISDTLQLEKILDKLKKVDGVVEISRES